MRVNSRIALLAIAAASVIGRGTAIAADIPVTSLIQKISSAGGCSLQEAIYSANLDTNQAVDFVNPDGTEHVITTGCVPGSGDDRILLPFSAVFYMNKVFDDLGNPSGPTATPIVTSNIVIEANGSRLEWFGPGNARVFTVGTTGRLWIRAAHIKGFRAKGGNGGAGGGGGGLGAGGAIYVRGQLIVDASTFERNGAIGGTGGRGPAHVGEVLSGGGGGGLGGNGGSGSGCVPAFRGDYCSGGGGGGGSWGDGGKPAIRGGGGGGGGGTLPRGGGNAAGALGGAAGVECGGRGADFETDAPRGRCRGGGGGGGGESFGFIFTYGYGGAGNYGGGGGGAGYHNALDGDAGDGGAGGFGGGGGASPNDDGDGGPGGFGGGGGATAYDVFSPNSADGGPFGGRGASSGGGGGGGAGLGGAIFSEYGTVTVRNSTFAANYVLRGAGGVAAFDNTSANGQDAGGAVFSLGGETRIFNSTIGRNESTGAGAGITIFHLEVECDLFEACLFPAQPLLELRNTIVAGNTVGQQCQALGAVVLGSGNLIHDNNGCPGVLTTGDPILGPLQFNAPGATPTMAIPPSSAAHDTADGATSLAKDQRGMARPKDNGYDIGAFERCANPSPDAGIGLQCFEPEAAQADTLTTAVSPAVAGSVTPPPGDQISNSVVVIRATANPGYLFVNWVGPVSDPLDPATTVIMSQDLAVTAVFAPIETDGVAPTTTASASPPANAAGWHNEDVNVGLTALDAPGGSGVKELTESQAGAQTQADTTVAGSAVTIPITSEGTTTVAFFATDNAGNLETPKSATVRIDRTSPTVLGTPSPAPNANGWNRTPVAVTFACSDALSGLAAGSPPLPTVLSTEGAGQFVAGQCSDLAGNSGVDRVLGINIDTTGPVVTPPAPNQVVQQSGPAGVTVTYPAPAIAESGSGLASSSCAPASGSVFPGGITTVTCTATDRAGNSGTASFAVTVVSTPDGRMFGAGYVPGGKRHYHFLFRASERGERDYGRLEVWVSDPRACGPDDGDRVHSGERDAEYGRPHRPHAHFVATTIRAIFSDDPLFRPGRGPRPTVDSVRLVGSGRWNGKSGYTFEATASDRGAERDTFSIVIKDAGGRVVAQVDGTLRFGNVESTRLR